MSALLSKGINDRPSYEYLQSPALWTRELYWGSFQKRGWSRDDPDNLKPTPACLLDPLELAAQLLQGTQSVSASLRQLSPGKPLLGSRACLRESLSTYLLSRKEGLRCIHLDNFRDFLKPSSCWLSELLGDALRSLGSSGAQGARRPSVFPCERVQLAYLIVQTEPVADWKSSAFLSPEDKQLTTCSLAQGTQRNKKNSNYDEAERVNEACGTLLALRSLKMSLKKDFLGQVALLPRRGKKDIIDYKMIHNYDCSAGSTYRLHWIPSYRVLIWVSGPEMVSFPLWPGNP